MKQIKYWITTAVVFTLFSFFAVGQVSAHEGSADWYAGEKAGTSQVIKDVGDGACSLKMDNPEHTAKQASGKYVDKLLDDGKSTDYVRGFRAAYENSWMVRLDTHCEH